MRHFIRWIRSFFSLPSYTSFPQPIAPNYYDDDDDWFWEDDGYESGFSSFD